MVAMLLENVLLAVELWLGVFIYEKCLDIWEVQEPPKITTYKLFFCPKQYRSSALLYSSKLLQHNAYYTNKCNTSVSSEAHTLHLVCLYPTVLGICTLENSALTCQTNYP